MVTRAAAALLVLSLLASPALAAAPTLPLDLAPGRLGDSLAALGQQAGISVSVDDAAIWSRPTPALRGRMPAAAALERLLAGSGAQAVRVGPGAWRIRRAPAAVRAQSKAPPAATMPTLELVVVTASKRDLRLGEFPGAASIIGGADLAFGGLPDTDTVLSKLATVSSTYLGAGRNKLFIRGIADSSFTGPTEATVGQYLGDIRLTYNAPDPDLRLYDIQSVEVLEGPQGTLYGAGSLGGIIRVTPNAPELGAYSGSVESGVSLTEHGAPGGDVSGMANLPIVSDKLGLRLVGYGVSDGGYIDNPLTGRQNINRTNTGGGRGALRFASENGWTVDISGIVQDIHGDDSQYADRGGPPLTRSSPIDEDFDADYRLVEAVIAKTWGDIHFQSSTALIRQHLDERFDATPPGGAPQLFLQRNDTHLLTSEARLWRPLDGALGWVMGVSYTDNSARLDRALGPPNAPAPMTGVLNEVQELTGYGEANLRLTPWLTATAGGRVSHSRLSGEGDDIAPAASIVEALAREAIVASRSSTSLLPSAALLARPAADLVVYVRYQEGYRPGGLAIDGDFVRRFENDQVKTSEAGVRYGRPGRGAFDLAFNVSHTLWERIQADFIDQNGLVTTDNIGDGRIWSVAASAGWRPIDSLRLDVAFSFNDGKITNPSPVYAAAFAAAVAASPSTGPGASARISEIPNVARETARIGLEWRQPLTDRLSLRVDGWGRYVGKSRLGVGPVLGQAQGDYFDSAITARVGTPAMGVTLGVTNLSDSVGNRFALGTPFVIGRNQITPLRPRTLRIGFDAHF